MDKEEIFEMAIRELAENALAQRKEDLAKMNSSFMMRFGH